MNKTHKSACYLMRQFYRAFPIRSALRSELSRTERAGCLFSRMFFFFSVLMNNDCSEKDGNRSQSSENNIKQFWSLHHSPPLSTKIPMLNRIVKINNPVKSSLALKPIGDTTGPNTSIATTNLQMSSNVFETFSLCFFVSSMRLILARELSFVNKRKGRV